MKNHSCASANDFTVLTIFFYCYQTVNFIFCIPSYVVNATAQIAVSILELLQCCWVFVYFYIV